MAGEIIPLAFESTQALAMLDQLEARLQRIGSISGNMPIGGGAAGGAGGGGSGQGNGGGAQAGASAAGGGSGPASAASSPASAPGGGAGGWANGIASVLTNLSGQMASGIAAQSPLNVEQGLLGGINETSAVRGANNLMFNAPADALDKVPGASVLAEALRAKGKAVERETFEPLENAAGRLSSVAAQLGRAGIDPSDADLAVGSEMLIQQERRAYENKKRAVQAVYGNGHVMDSFTFALGHAF